MKNLKIESQEASKLQWNSKTHKKTILNDSKAPNFAVQNSIYSCSKFSIKAIRIDKLDSPTGFGDLPFALFHRHYALILKISRSYNFWAVHLIIAE